MNAPLLPSQTVDAQLAKSGPDADLIEACQRAIWAIAVYCRAVHRGKRKKAPRRAMLEALYGVCDLPAMTMLGAAWKSTVITAWQSLGVEIGIGDRLVASLLHDVRLLGTGGNDGRSRLAERKVA